MLLKSRYHSVFWCGLWGTISATTVGRTQVVKRLLDKGELISKTVEDVAQTKAEATEHVCSWLLLVLCSQWRCLLRHCTSVDPHEKNRDSYTHWELFYKRFRQQGFTLPPSACHLNDQVSDDRNSFIRSRLTPFPANVLPRGLPTTYHESNTEQQPVENAPPLS